LEKNIKENTKLNEVEAADQLEQFRSTLPDFVGLSFDTISAYGPNGAIIHYKPDSSNCAVISTDNLYLCDSGGQYKTGTTDITRTVHFGKPSAHMIKTNTLVLEGHCQLARAKFPEKLQPNKLDVLARTPLWKLGLDYEHGTSHGVGAYLNVHEYPPSMTRRISSEDSPPLLPGMILSNEPGYYEEGNFGIRIENLLLVKECEELSGKKKFLEFETISLVPFQRDLIDLDLLSDEARQWVDSYHERCLNEVGPILKKRNEDAFNWLVNSCTPLKQ